jgi:guanylate kinase
MNKFNYEYPLIFVLGPSGSGKDTVLNLVKEKDRNLVFPPTLTSRPKREGENDGIYKFITKKEFLEYVDDKSFIEYDEHFGNFYGTSRNLIIDAIKKGPAIKQVDINGMKKIINSSDLEYNRSNHSLLIQENRLVNVYFVGIVRESIEITKDALIKRDGLNKTEQRIKKISDEYDYILKNCDYKIINKENQKQITADNFLKLIYEICSIPK